MPSESAISVVMPTLGLRGGVERALASMLRARRRYQGPSEMILSDASSGRDAGRLARLAADHDARVVRGPRGIGRQRNRGWRAARHDVALFVDSDCAAAPDLLDAVAAAMCRTDCVAGRVAFAGSRSVVLDAAVGTGVAAAFDGFGKPAGSVLPWAVTANLAVRLLLLERVGGFDESLPAGEDVDLGLRLAAAGHEIRYAPSALVLHETASWSGLGAAAGRFLGYGRGDAHLLRRYPRLGRPARADLPVLLPLVTASAALRAARDRSPAWLALAPAWLLATVAAYAALARRDGLSPTTATLGFGLMQCLVAGRRFEALRRRDWRSFACEPVLDAGQAARERLAARRARLAMALGALPLALLLA
jgi:hypothetical protein